MYCKILLDSLTLKVASYVTEISGWFRPYVFQVSVIIFQGQRFFCYLQIRYFTKEEVTTMTTNAITSEKIPFKKYPRIPLVWNIVSVHCKMATLKAFLENAQIV